MIEMPHDFAVSSFQGSSGPWHGKGRRELVILKMIQKLLREELAIDMQVELAMING